MRIVFCGPSCTGKTTLIEKLQQDPDLTIPKFINHTTRSIRSNECQGFPYHFLNESDFKKNISNDSYFCWVNYNNHYYGVPRTCLEQKNWSLDITSDCWKYFKKIPEVVGIYLLPPSIEELERRAKQRGDLTDNIKKRIETIQIDQELEMAKEFDYCLSTNEDLSIIYNDLKLILKKHFKL